MNIMNYENPFENQPGTTDGNFAPFLDEKRELLLSRVRVLVSRIFSQKDTFSKVKSKSSYLVNIQP